MPPTRGPAHGRGCAVVRALGAELFERSLSREAKASNAGSGYTPARPTEAHFAELSYRYPLKLLSPETHSDSSTVPLKIAYILSYGGGLVSGDVVELDVTVGTYAALMLLTQGSTKIFRTRVLPSSALAASSRVNATLEASSSQTRQTMTVHLEHSSSLILLPDPVTAFAQASYSQAQRFYLPDCSDTSLILLDWFTSGRMARGEEWQFEEYRSSNEIWVDGKRLARDVMLLQQTKENTVRSQADNGLPPRTLKDRLAPYACYATLFLIGPLPSQCIQMLEVQYNRISQMKAGKPPDLLWSMSPLLLPRDTPSSTTVSSNKDIEATPSKTRSDSSSRSPIVCGSIVRIAAKETEQVRNWIRDALDPLKRDLGEDALRTAFI